MKNKYSSTIQCIIEALSEKYHIDINTATNIVNNSFIIELLEEEFEFVTHYDAYYWATEIMNDEILV